MDLFFLAVLIIMSLFSNICTMYNLSKILWRQVAVEWCNSLACDAMYVFYIIFLITYFDIVRSVFERQIKSAVSRRETENARLVITLKSFTFTLKKIYIHLKFLKSKIQYRVHNKNEKRKLTSDERVRKERNRRSNFSMVFTAVYSSSHIFIY